MATNVRRQKPAQQTYSLVTLPLRTPSGVRGHVARYRTNRDLLLTGLPALGIDRLAPADGAFYAYADVSELTSDSMSWCARLLADTGVAIAPGHDFDPARGGEFVRMSFAGATDDIRTALARLGEWLASARRS